MENNERTHEANENKENSDSTTTKAPKVTQGRYIILTPRCIANPYQVSPTTALARDSPNSKPPTSTVPHMASSGSSWADLGCSKPSSLRSKLSDSVCSSCGKSTIVNAETLQSFFSGNHSLKTLPNQQPEVQRIRAKNLLVMVLRKRSMRMAPLQRGKITLFSSDCFFFHNWFWK